MTEHPILFSGPMVRAILDGRKTVTRRVIKDQPRVERHKMGHEVFYWRAKIATPLNIAPDLMRQFCPYGAVGGRLWARETWAYVGPGSGSDLPDYVEERRNPEHHTPRNCWYRADGERGITWTPSIHMPRWASRISLEVTGVRVERLQAITEADAQAEGAELTGDDEAQDGAPDAPRAESFRAGFASLWDGINAERGYSWASDPWVWRIAFRRVEP